MLRHMSLNKFKTEIIPSISFKHDGMKLEINHKLQDTKNQYTEVCFSIGSELWEKEMKIPFTIATKRIKYLEINVTKKAKDLYTEKSQYNAEEQKWRANTTGLQDCL